MLYTAPWILACSGGEPVSTAPVTHVVEIREMGFHPAEVAARAGDTIVWINRDFVTHTATDPDSTWTTPPLAQGERWRSVVTASMGGTYICAYHPVMEARVTIESASSEEKQP